MLYLSADHRGHELKEHIQTWIESTPEPSYAGETRDLSAQKVPGDDYPLVAAELGRLVASDDINKGVLFCGSGVGAVAAVNKIKGIRGAIGLSPQQVAAGRHDDDMNVLVIAADHTERGQAEELVRAFLTTSFNGEVERYGRRIKQIKELETE